MDLSSCFETYKLAEIPLIYSHTIVLFFSLYLYVLFSKKSGLIVSIYKRITIMTIIWVLLSFVTWYLYSMDILVKAAWAPTEFLLSYIFYLVYEFVSAYIEIPLPKYVNYLLFALIIPLIILAPTHYFLEGYSYLDCEVVEGVKYIQYASVVRAIIIGTAVFAIARSYLLTKKKPSLYLVLSVFSFLFSFYVMSFISSITGNYVFELYGVLSTLVFLVLFANLSLSEKLLQNKSLVANILIALMFIANIPRIFFSRNTLDLVLSVIESFVILILGFYLVKSFKKIVETEEESKVANTKLVELDQQKNEFLSFATHQLKSPLTAMKWGMETLKDMDAVTSEDEVAQRKSIVSKLYDTTNDLIRTVTDLLDISKIEQGGLVLKIENFDWVSFTKRISEEFRMTAQLKGLVLRVDIPDEVITVSGDQTKLRQVVVNIVDNAIKYTPTGTVSVSVVRDADNVLVKVSDTGPGIEPEELGKLFNKFSRGAAGKGSGNAGSGLGLYLVKKIMELHHGDVWAESAGIGTGSQFYIKLPILSEAADKIIQ